LTLCDAVPGADPRWGLARLAHAAPTDGPWERYGLFVLGGRASHWLGRSADWARLCAGAGA
ncbi:MAG: hypothetical protein M3P70_05960, partial [Actinomycetota bacterium]|nr:hypothetical protein [Actinomycetota bacterium]